MKLRYKRGIDTRKLYQFEKIKLSDYLEKDRSISELRSLACWIWNYEKLKWVDFPLIKTGKGFYFNGRYLSCYYYDDTKYWNEIVFARQERNYKTLIHELTHAMGFYDHDEKFIEKYFGLLVHYTDQDPVILLNYINESQKK